MRLISFKMQDAPELIYSQERFEAAVLELIRPKSDKKLKITVFGPDNQEIKMEIPDPDSEKNRDILIRLRIASCLEYVEDWI